MCPRCKSKDVSKWGKWIICRSCRHAWVDPSKIKSTTKTKG